jgi:hypothetical protein
MLKVFDTPEKLERLKEMRARNAPMWEVVAEFQCSPNIINREIAELGLAPYRKNVSRKVIREMWVANKRVDEIAAAIGCNATYVAKIACQELGLKKRSPSQILKAQMEVMQRQIADRDAALADKDAQIASLQAKLAAGCSVSSNAKAKPQKIPYAGYDETEEHNLTGTPKKPPTPPALQNGMIGAQLSEEQQAELRRKLA